LILTGARRNEVAETTWGEVDLASKLWTLPKERAKNGREHSVPLSDSATEILRSLPRFACSELVFTRNGRNRITGFARLKKQIDELMPQDTPPWVFHDLRRTFASGCAKLGVAIHVVEKCLNHSSGTFRGIVSVYQKHDFANEQRAAMAAWARHVEAVVSGEPANILPMTRRT
jgi:integrase